jgi:hypothetical protein
MTSVNASASRGVLRLGAEIVNSRLQWLDVLAM